MMNTMMITAVAAFALTTGVQAQNAGDVTIAVGTVAALSVISSS